MNADFDIGIVLSMCLGVNKYHSSVSIISSCSQSTIIVSGLRFRVGNVLSKGTPADFGFRESVFLNRVRAQGMAKAN